MARVSIRSERCKGCDTCARVCPQGVLALGKQLNDEGFYYACVQHPERCLGCRQCAIACPDMAITLQQVGTVYHYFSY